MGVCSLVGGGAVGPGGGEGEGWVVVGLAGGQSGIWGGAVAGVSCRMPGGDAPLL